MKKAKFLFIIMLFFTIRADCQNTKWYEGGNLHNADVGQWKKAEFENKLATSADWLLTSQMMKSYANRNGMDALKNFAIALVGCIDTKTAAMDNQSKDLVKTIATECMAMHGWK